MLILGAAASVAAMYATGFWIAGVAVALLFALWRVLPVPEGPPILALALTYQWIQVSIGVFYTGLTGDRLAAFNTAWLEMMLIGLGSIVSIAVGLMAGMRLMRALLPPDPEAPREALSSNVLLMAYGASVVVTGVIQQIAWSFPGLTQAIFALNFSHLGLVYLLLRRFSHPTVQWHLYVGLLAFEVLLGFTGYFAGFREPLIMGVIVGLETLRVNKNKVRHWASLAALVVVLGLASVLWLSVRSEYRSDFDEELFAASRAERLEHIATLANDAVGGGAENFEFAVLDLVDRMWVIYYPALAYERVPSFLAHSDGQIMGAALRHLVTPRLLFPDKPPLPSDSEMVRRYSGIEVAGEEENTSIAFGYAAEAYVDFGLPLMFLPLLLYGSLLGAGYWWCLYGIKHRELAIGLATVILWLSLHLFERSWVKMVGLNLTLMAYLGGVTFLLDRYLVARRLQRMLAFAPPEPTRAPGR